MHLLSFLKKNREQLLNFCMTQILNESIVKHSRNEIESGMPIFIDQLIKSLTKDESYSDLGKEMKESAIKHGESLFERGFTIFEVVTTYDCLCEHVMNLAKEQKESFFPAKVSSIKCTFFIPVPGRIAPIAVSV